MKVIIDARMYGLEYTGIGRYVMNLINKLMDQETDIEFTLLLKRKYFDQLKLANNWNKVLTDIPHYSIGEQTQLLSLINKQNHDLVHFPHFNLPLFYKKPFVVTVHDMTMHRRDFNATNQSKIKYLIKHQAYKKAFDHAVYSSRAIITPSKAVKDEITHSFKISSDKIFPIYEGLEEGYQQSSEQAGGLEVLAEYQLNPFKYFFYIGNLYPHKNIKIVIDAIVTINKQSSEKLYLAIAGARNVFLEKLEHYVTGKNASEYIKFLGYVREGNMPVLYSNSIAFVFPSLSEGFGLPGLEALAAGSLLIASDIPVFHEVYQDKVVYFDPSNTDQLIKAMEDVAGYNMQKRSVLIRQAQDYIKKYSWQKMAEETLVVYKSVLKNTSQ